MLFRAHETECCARLLWYILSVKVWFHGKTWLISGTGHRTEIWKVCKNSELQKKTSLNRSERWKDSPVFEGKTLWIFDSEYFALHSKNIVKVFLNNRLCFEKFNHHIFFFRKFHICLYSATTRLTLRLNARCVFVLTIASFFPTWDGCTWFSNTYTKIGMIQRRLACKRSSNRNSFRIFLGLEFISCGLIME